MLVIAIGAAMLVVASVLAQTTRTVWDGVYSDAQAKRGRALYESKAAGRNRVTSGEHRGITPNVG